LLTDLKQKAVNAREKCRGDLISSIYGRCVKNHFGAMMVEVRTKPNIWMAVTGHYKIQICFKAWIFKGDTISD
jgi:hypothetical protein